MSGYQLWMRHPESHVWAAHGDPSPNVAALYEAARQLIHVDQVYDAGVVWQSGCPYTGCEGHVVITADAEGQARASCPACRRDL